jgi:hypothetical protein
MLLIELREDQIDLGYWDRAFLTQESIDVPGGL